MDGGAWRATVHRVTESDTTERLSSSSSSNSITGIEHLNLFLSDDDECGVQTYTCI